MSASLGRRQVLGGMIAGAVGVAAPLRADAATGSVRATGPTECSPRYLGYRDADRKTPWAQYFQAKTLPVQPEVAQALRAPATPPAAIPAFTALAGELNRPGHSPVETGYGQLGDGTVWVAARTSMPRVTAAMWDWWFGWHLTHANRYKLWHPDAHAFASVTPGITGPAGKRYIGQTSYVDEYIGPYLEQLAITFDDPRAAGFTVSDDTTVIHARVGSAILPVDLGWVAHQVRPAPDGRGSEMRSRFYLNRPGLRDVDGAQAACAIVRDPLPTLQTPLPFNAAFGRELMGHCGAEMNHLASFLPELYARFRSTP